MTHPCRRILTISLALVAMAFTPFGLSARADDDGSSPASHNLQRVGHTDLLGRTAYQPTLHTIHGRVYLFVGHFGGTTLHGLPNGGTSIVDVTNPSDPNQVA